MLPKLYATLPGASGGFPQNLGRLELILQSHLARDLEGLLLWGWKSELGTIQVSLLV